MEISEARVKEYILRVLIEQMNLPITADEVQDDTSMGPEGLDLESLAFVELTLALETEYSVKIRDEELEELGHLSFGELAANVATRIAG